MDGWVKEMIIQEASQEEEGVGGKSNHIFYTNKYPHKK